MDCEQYVISGDQIDQLRLSAERFGRMCGGGVATSGAIEQADRELRELTNKMRRTPVEHLGFNFIGFAQFGEIDPVRDA